MKLVEPEGRVDVMVAEERPHLLQVFTILLKDVDVFAHYFAPLAQLLRILLTTNKGPLPITIGTRTCERVYA